MKIALAALATLLFLPAVPSAVQAACVPFETHSGLMTCRNAPEMRERDRDHERRRDRDRRHRDDRDRREDRRRSADRFSGFENNFVVRRRHSGERDCRTVEKRRIRNDRVVIETRTVCRD